MRAILLLTVCAFLVSLIAAEKGPKASGRPAYFLEGVSADIEYRHGLTLDAYAPAGERRPAAIILHGASGDKSTHLTQLLPLLSNAGYAWFALNYRNSED